MNNVEMARKFAEAEHAGQMYGAYPYMLHLTQTVQYLTEFGVTDDDLLAAGWLHDVVEDTAVTLDEVQEIFGKRVASLVWAVTNEPDERLNERSNRASRHALTYPKIKAMPGATTLKLGDRLANVSFSFASRDSGKLRMYKKEYADFRDALFVAGENEKMWATLDAMIFFSLPGQGDK